MLKISEIKERLKEKSEKEFRLLLITLFEEIGFKEVTHTHGITEFGKDIVYYDIDKLEKEKWVACVVKANDVSQTNYHDISRQINECFKKPYDSITKGRVKIDEVLVLTSGVFKANTKSLIAEEITNKATNVSYWEISQVSQKLHKHNLGKYLETQIDIGKSKYHEYIQKTLSSDNSIRILQSDFDLNINSLEKIQIKIRTKERSFKEEVNKYTENNANIINLNLLPDIDKILTNNKSILLIGIATSGKTTILKQIGISQLTRDPSSNIFFIEVAKLFTKEGKISIKNYIEKIYQDNSGTELNFKNVKTLILLDGLDELNEDVNKENIINQAIELKDDFNVQIIISSRENEFLEENPQIKRNFTTHELLPLNISEMLELGIKIIDDEGKTKDFTNLIKRNEIINSFPKTPLTTILLAILYKEGKIDTKELPKNIYELYSKFIDLFLNKWDKNKGISEQFTIKQKEFVLSQIANFMHANGEVSIHASELYKFLGQLNSKKGIQGLDDPESFLKQICSRSNILLKNEAEQTFKFFHLTIQEYLSVGTLKRENDHILKENFYDNWWLNPNIFYAGAHPDEAYILEEISKLNNYPITAHQKYNFVIHGTKILQASHLVDKEVRKNILISIIKIFDDLNQELIKIFVEHDEPRLKLKERTILDRILWARKFFYEFLSPSQFIPELESIWQEVKNLNLEYTDITEYSIAYCLSSVKKNSEFLIDFVYGKENINVRWFKIVDVDLNIKKLEIDNKKIRQKIRNKAEKHKKYIQQQFKESLKKHYTSITGINSDPI